MEHYKWLYEESMHAIARDVLSRKVDINSISIRGDPALHAAALVGDEGIVRSFLDAGADVTFRNEYGETALHRSIRSGLNFYDKYSWTNVNIVRMLLDGGCDINARQTFDGLAALHLAVLEKNIDLVRLLLERGANVNAVDNKGRTPLHAAVYNYLRPCLIYHATEDQDDIKRNNKFVKPDERILHIFNLLAEYKAYFGARDQDGLTVMDYAIYYSGKFGFDLKLIDTLLKYGGVDINAVYTPLEVNKRKGQTILHEACLRTNKRDVKFLLKNGANIEAQDVFRRTPLHNFVLDICTYFSMRKLNFLHYFLEWNPKVNSIFVDRALFLNVFKNQVYMDFLFKALIEHLAKQEAAGLNLDATLLKTISNNLNLSHHFTRCKEELKNAHDRQLDSSWVTLLHLLIDDKQKLIMYAENHELVTDFENSNVVKSFPIYGPCIADRFEKAIENQKTLRHSAEILSSSLPIILDPRHIVVKKILSYCKLKELRILCQQPTP